MDQPETYAIAVHEAGHAIMAAACGFKNVRIELSEQDNSLGRTIFDPEPPSSENFHMRHALVAIAGMITEKIVTGETPSLDHVSKDYGAAISHIAALHGCSLESVSERVLGYMIQSLPLGFIEEVAMSAMIMGELSAEAFSAYVSRIPPIDLD